MCYIYSPSTIGINKGSYHNYYKPFTILRHCLGCYLDQLGSKGCCLLSFLVLTLFFMYVTY